MSHANTLKHLAALLLSGAALVGCGGGDAEPPPPPVGSPPAGPDTTAPTVTIATNVSAPTATGPVTFTFVFSEDVGVSFDGTDITVEGGTAGAFTRVDGAQATLVVTPTPGVPGTMTVSVAAGRFTDIAGNANAAAASASKNYAVAPPPPPPPTSGTVLANFDSVSPPIAGFEGGEGSAVEAGPSGGSGNALKVLRSGGQVFALALVNLPSNIPLAAGRLTISARVNSPTAGIPMVIKLEGPGGNPSSGELRANEAVVVGWQTLTWTVPAVNTSYNTLVLLPNLGTVDAPPGKAYYFDDIQLLGAASGGGGGGGTLTFSSGLAAGNRTVEGGEFGGFSGSNQDGFNCSGAPASCGGGGDVVSPTVTAADSFFFYYYQTPTPATALYMGIFVLAPGITGGLSNTADNTGVQINGQTSIKFKLGQNPEWFGTATNKFAVDLTLGKRYVVGGNTCRVQLRTIVTPTAAAATVYTVPLSGFSVVQDCAQGGLTVASALAASPISQVSFQGVGGSIALTAGGQTSGANLSVAVGGVYPTTLVVAGGITFE
jgi:Bacterial Ig-like domain